MSICSKYFWASRSFLHFNLRIRGNIGLRTDYIPHLNFVDSRSRTGEVLPLTTRATNAAWPRSNDAVPEHADINRPRNIIPPQSNRQGMGLY